MPSVLQAASFDAETGVLLGNARRDHRRLHACASRRRRIAAVAPEYHNTAETTKQTPVKLAKVNEHTMPRLRTSSSRSESENRGCASQGYAENRARVRSRPRVILRRHVERRRRTTLVDNGERPAETSPPAESPARRQRKCGRVDAWRRCGRTRATLDLGLSRGDAVAHERLQSRDRASRRFPRGLEVGARRGSEVA